MTSPRLVVVGSANLDQVFTVRAAPGPGMTVSSTDYLEEAGGKGLNQALAAARMGAHVRFVGAVGDDDAGRLLQRTLGDAGVDVSHVRVVDEPTGRASIVVDAARENRIVLLGGANGTVVSLTDEDRRIVAAADGVLLQLELPTSAALDTARTAARAGVPVALTPAPVQPLGDDLLAATTLLFANEHETAALTGTDDPEDGIRRLLDLVPSVVVTRGARGSDYADRAGQRLSVAARVVDPVDTTAAGDVYAGVFMAAYSSGGTIGQAMRQGTVAASLAVQRRGTSGSIPTRDAVLGVVPAP